VVIHGADLVDLIHRPRRAFKGSGRDVVSPWQYTSSGPGGTGAMSAWKSRRLRRRRRWPFLVVQPESEAALVQRRSGRGQVMMASWCLVLLRTYGVYWHVDIVCVDDSLEKTSAGGVSDAREVSF